jgi:hypothetical protein
MKDISSEETIGAALTFLVVVGEVRDSWLIGAQVGAIWASLRRDTMQLTRYSRLLLKLVKEKQWSSFDVL